MIDVLVLDEADRMIADHWLIATDRMIGAIVIGCVWYVLICDWTLV